jgi:phage/conjugal plasmid C-4 type zinc finger TraR family protein
VSDLADEAQALEEAERARALSALRRREPPFAPPIEAAECIDCGDAIPKARRKAVPQARRCTGCEARHEKVMR